MNAAEGLRGTRGYLLVFGLLMAVIYHQIAVEMVMNWEHDPNYSHGFLVPFIAGYLLWLRRDAVRQVPVKPAAGGMVILTGGLVTLLLGVSSVEFMTMRSSMIIVTAGMIAFVYGYPLLRVLLVPLGYLFFMIPIPYILYDEVAFPLKLFVAKVAVAGLKLFSLPVLREGNVIIFPNITLEVVDACSGMRSLMSLLALSTAYGFMFLRRPWQRVVLVLAAVPVAVATNVFRVFVTGFLARHVGKGAAEGFFHDFAGLAVFATAMVLIAVIGWLLSMGGRNAR
ncbi:eight transmembrane protein EpsH [Oleidesulfovibrio alaskensis G20]|uniref:Eight transmembrane protein EpsH n=1 Tax=Oleidesulfovibrio alaskensis (strain ATCC BAA-1058 / DSM 17464 / G20) TaxID=207559 RepID=Q314J8_OLEA2|nr:exosortase A [Oleidesulfovibrio alaskensis]ABB37648.1 eight transmembrane protein EpsH [Oleidesulfovibrio alaskensis G20]MBG0773569.1 exosortase/archaeosortase family protein [Oleidesulfovibrio alaskensis]